MCEKSIFLSTSLFLQNKQHQCRSAVGQCFLVIMRCLVDVSVIRLLRNVRFAISVILTDSTRLKMVMFTNRVKCIFES